MSMITGIYYNIYHYGVLYLKIGFITLYQVADEKNVLGSRSAGC